MDLFNNHQKQEPVKKCNEIENCACGLFRKLETGTPITQLVLDSGDSITSLVFLSFDEKTNCITLTRNFITENTLTLSCEDVSLVFLRTDPEA